MGTTHELNDTSPQGGLRLVQRPRTSSLQEELGSELVARLRACADELKTAFPELSTKAVATDAVRLFSRALLPKARASGRPRSGIIDNACELLGSGVPWRHVPWQVLPGFARMSPHDQSDARENLRRAIYMRERRKAVTNQEQAS